MKICFWKRSALFEYVLNPLSPRGQKVKFANICIDDYSSQSIVPIDLWMVLLDQQVVEIWENGV